MPNRNNTTFSSGLINESNNNRRNLLFMKKTLTLLLIVAYVNAFAQLSTNEEPIGYKMYSKLIVKNISSNATVILPSLNKKKIELEDLDDEKNNVPPRFGYPFKVNFDLKNSGTWSELPNGDKLWQLNVICPGALSVNFCYDKFWIPEGGKFFVYSKDGKHSIGAFTSRNNKGDNIDVRGFATGLVYGDDIILEYYQPRCVTSEAIISIEYVVHGYRFVNNSDFLSAKAGTCQVNINCSEGQEWQNEKQAVAIIIISGTRLGTGSLLNESNLSQKPLFLTANHCIRDGRDAAGNSNLYYYVFYWNYETPGCEDVYVPLTYSTSGATILANNNSSDFALLRLTEDPKDLSGYIPFYLGWDSSGQSGTKGVCIHHPSDVKKIATVAYPVSTTFWPNDPTQAFIFWSVLFCETPNGFSIPSYGSSGSALLTAEHKIIGHLKGGYGSCNDPEDHSCWFGKFDVSWTGNGNDSIQRRLDCWLDSLNTGMQSIEGLLIIPSSRIINTDQQLYSNIRITNGGQLTIQSDVELMGNSRVIVELGGTLVIDGGTLSNVDVELKAGASLIILNSGVLETRYGFLAPVGAIVDVESGQII
jgi:hypothetical protein